MAMKKSEEFQRIAAEAAKKARELAEQAEHDGVTLEGDGKKDYDNDMAKAADYLQKSRDAKADEGILEQAKSLAAEIGGTASDDLDVQGKGSDSLARVKNLGLEVVQSPEFKAAMAPFAGRGGVPERAKFSTDPISVKGLFVGGEATSAGAFVTPEQTGIVEMLGRRDLRIRDAVSVRRTGSDSVEYVRQTSHTNAAAPVAEATNAGAPTGNADGGSGDVTFSNVPGGGYAPEGSWAFERKTATVKTIAEWVPATKRALADAAQLEGLINDELAADVAEAEEGQMVTGDGTGENLPGILSTEGIQSQAFDKDIFRTVRKGLTKARRVGRVVPNAVALNPEDVETVDLARENGDTGKYLGQGPFSMGPRTLWGVPILETEAVEAGQGLIGDFSKAVLWDREQTTVSVTDSHSDFFIRRLVAVLAEERAAFGVTRPTAFVKAALSA